MSGSPTFDAYLDWCALSREAQSEQWHAMTEAIVKNRAAKFDPKRKVVYAQTMTTNKRIPGTYEPGDRVRLIYTPSTEGTVVYDNRKDGGRNMWVQIDGDRDSFCATPESFISTEAGK